MLKTKKPKNWIKGAVKHPGAFTKTKEHSKEGKKMSMAEFAKHVKAHPEKFNKTTEKRAQFALTMAKIAKHNKKK